MSSSTIVLILLFTFFFFFFFFLGQEDPTAELETTIYADSWRELIHFPVWPSSPERVGLVR